MADAPLYKRHRRYTRELHDIKIHGNKKLHVVCRSKGRDVDKMLCKLRRKLVVLPAKRIGVDVEYTHYEEPQKAAVLQLCVEDECLVYHISAAKDRPLQLEEFLMNDEYTFAGFAIEGDKRKLKLSDLEINSNKYIDIQVEWRNPYSRKDFDSLADVAGIVIDNHYKNMKKVINKEEDQTLWGFCPLPEKLIKYAAIDSYASYDSWRRIDDIAEGLQIAKEEKEVRNKNKDVIPCSNYEKKNHKKIEMCWVLLFCAIVLNLL